MAVGVAANPATLEGIYARHLRDSRAITPHLERLRGLATGLELAVESGVKHGASSSALLMGAKRVISFDIRETPGARELERAAPHWEYRIEDSRTAHVPACDMLFIDSEHTLQQCCDELDNAAHAVKRFLVFHDVGTFGEVGADGETGCHLWQYSSPVIESVPADHVGIRPAIDWLMRDDPSWRIKERYVDSHGLLVLERRLP